MAKKRKKSRLRKQVHEPIKNDRLRSLLNFILAFTLGALVVGVAVFWVTRDNTYSPAREHSAGIAGQRTTADLMAMSDDQLEQVDIVEMNIAVAQEIPGLDKLEYSKYRRIVDGWTNQFRQWLPTVGHAFHQDPGKYKNDINFFHLGMLAQFLDQSVGIAYNEKQKQIMLQDRKTGKKASVRYTNAGDLLLHGLLDTNRGTCATMPTLHVAIGRRLVWQR